MTNKYEQEINQLMELQTKVGDLLATLDNHAGITDSIREKKLLRSGVHFLRYVYDNLSWTISVLEQLQ